MKVGSSRVVADEAGSADRTTDEDGRISYRVLDFEELEGAAAEHYRRRRRRRLLTFVTLPGLVLGTATVATAFGTGLLGQPEAPVCNPVSAPAPSRSSFEIEVLNSNDTAGLGTEVARTLEGRDFRVSSVGNAPETVYVKDAAVIYHGAKGMDTALLLQKQIPGAKLWKDGRSGRDVQLVLGYGFDKLTDEPPPPPPAPSQITVNVYNTTFHEGLATDVGKVLKEREFHLGEVGNDPQRSFLADDVAVIRYGPDGAGAAERLSEQVEGGRLEQVDRSGGTIDLVIGNDFHGLRAETEVPRVAPYVRPAETIERPCGTR